MQHMIYIEVLIQMTCVKFDFQFHKLPNDLEIDLLTTLRSLKSKFH